MVGKTLGSLALIMVHTEDMAITNCVCFPGIELVVLPDHSDQGKNLTSTT